jgi:hypothetical protein
MFYLHPPAVTNSGLHTKVALLREKFSSIWMEMPGDFPTFSRAYTVAEQAVNERKLDDTVEKNASESRGLNDLYNIDHLETEKIKASVRLSLAGLLQSSPIAQQDEFMDDCTESAIDFIKQAKRFDPLLSGEEIHQALRNVWIINSLQLYLGKPVLVTPSAFAYSMLYPYTDDYLDDSEATRPEKERFISDVRSLLLGERIQLGNSNLKKISCLIAMIEKEYPRRSYPLVYESLLEIHRAQGRSLDEHGDIFNPETNSLLDISCDKGGTSVLADAYLAAGTLDERFMEFMFGLGVVLQFIDDFQDIDQDSQNDHCTLFTEQNDKNDFELATNRLLNFTLWLKCAEDIFPAEDAKALSDLSLVSCRILILEAVARSSHRFTHSYLEQLERYSPLRFSYLRNVKTAIEDTCREKSPANNTSLEELTV